MLSSQRGVPNAAREEGEKHYPGERDRGDVLPELGELLFGDWGLPELVEARLLGMPPDGLVGDLHPKLTSGSTDATFRWGTSLAATCHCSLLLPGQGPMIDPKQTKEVDGRHVGGN